MNETSKKRAGTNRNVTGTLMGFNHEFVYVDARYKPLALGSLAPFLATLVLSDVIGFSWWWAIVALIPAIPTLFGDLSIALSKNVAQKDRVYKLRMKLEQFYHSIPGGGICARAMPMTASDVAGLNERAQNWAAAGEQRKVAMRMLQKEKLDDPANTVVFRTMHLPGLMQAGKDAQAKEQLEEIIKEAELHLSERPIQVGHCLSVCAVTLADAGRFDEANALGQRAIDAMSAVDIDAEHVKLTQHMNSYANCLNNLAYINRCGGRYKGAASFLERAYAIRKSGYCVTRDFSHIIDVVNQLATTYLWAGDDVQATLWVLAAGKLIGEEREAMTLDAIDAAQVNLEYYMAKKNNSTAVACRIVELAKNDRWQPFNIRLENFVMLAEYYRSIKNSTLAAEYFTKAYALLDDLNPGREIWIARIRKCEEQEGFGSIEEAVES